MKSRRAAHPAAWQRARAHAGDAGAQGRRERAITPALRGGAGTGKSARLIFMPRFCRSAARARQR